VAGYEVLSFLGEGGMGVVYRARQVALDRLVALKLLRGGSSKRLARFRAEALADARLQHPHVVQIFEIGEHQGQPYLALELLEGGSLEAKLAGRPQSPHDAATLVCVLARAIQYAHSRGIVHRDLKPSNVLLTAEGTAKIADFGLAKFLQAAEGQTQEGDLVGTPRYMAPEQTSGALEAVGPTADIYSLGVILYELLTGAPPCRRPRPWKRCS
jgi:serine/threonine-protein kinase